MDFATHYYPNVLEAMRTRWISPQFIATNRIDSERGYDEVREMGRAVIRALGIGTSATHMEWFAGPKGLYFSEIGCRPPGVRCWDLYAAGNDIDIYGEWAMAVVHGRVSRAPSRRFSAGIIALRPDHDGSITHYDGVDEIQARHGEWVIDAHLPPAGHADASRSRPGTWPTPGSACATPTTTSSASMLDDVGRTVKVHASEILKRFEVTDGRILPRKSGAGGDGLLGRFGHCDPKSMTKFSGPHDGGLPIGRVERGGRLTRSMRGAAGEPFPIVEPSVCTFAYRGPVISVQLAHFGVGLPDDLSFEQLGDARVVGAGPRHPRRHTPRVQARRRRQLRQPLHRRPAEPHRRLAPVRRQLGVRVMGLRRAVVGAARRRRAGGNVHGRQRLERASSAGTPA